MATFTVTTLLDENDAGATVEAPGGDGLSLREAITLSNAAEGADRIEFAEDLSGLLRLDFDPDGASPYINQLFVTDEVTIDGGGVITITGDAQDNDITTTGDITTLAGNGVAQLADNSRVFFVRENADTTLIGLTLTGGRARNDNGHGGVIFSQSDLTLIDSQVTGNSTSGDDAKGGGIFSRTNITLIDTEIRDNSTSGERSDGGGVAAEGTLTITRSEISENFAVGRASDGGGAYAGGDLVVSASNISGNAVSEFAADGGGLATRGALTLTNSTVAYNQVTGYRGYGGGISVYGDATISQSTIVGNSVAQAPAFPQRSAGSAVSFKEDLVVNNSIIVGNVFPTADDPEVAAYLPYQPYSLTFTGLNIIGATADRFDPSGRTTVINAAPGDVFEGGENGFGFKGAAVQTIALSADPDNPALDAAAGDDIAGTDARGVPGGGLRDLGAYELVTDANLIVTTGDDVVDAGDGFLSLREAVAFANLTGDANRITFAEEAGDLIRLTEGAIFVTGDLTVDGGGRVTITGDANGDDVTDAQGVTDVAATGSELLDDNSRIFSSSTSDLTLTIDGLTITGGRNGSPFDGGGAIRVVDGAVEIIDSTISGNSTSGYSAGGGAIFADGITVTGGVITGNETSGDRAKGGALYASGALTITESEVYGNTTSGTRSYGGAAATRSALIVTNSSVADNTTTGYVGTGGALHSLGSITITASTLSGNASSGRYAHGGAAFSLRGLYLDQATVSGNGVTGVSARGGGLYHSGLGGESLTLTNSIVLGNIAAQAENDEIDEGGNPGGSLAMTGANIVGRDGESGADIFDGETDVGDTTAAEIFAATRDNAGVAAGVLADNGGAVSTIALKTNPGNPALDASSGAGSDARGFARVDLSFVDNGGVADLGAFEVRTSDLTAPSFNTVALQSAVENQIDAGVVSASDDLPGVTFAIIGGADAALFTINAETGVISFRAPPDFEAPGDAGADNNYDLVIAATDVTDQVSELSLRIQVTDEVDRLDGTAEGDRIEGGDGRDRISGLQGRDTLLGRDGNDVIRGGLDNDNLRGGDGDDVVRGQNGADRMFGNLGDDTLVGSIGEDTLKGNADDDRLIGGGAADRLFGGTGDDTLIGSAGDDRLLGAAGDDLLVGGTGVDRFIFRQNGGDDVIQDFEDGVERMRIQNGAESFSDLVVTQVGADARIAFTGASITLRNFDAEDLSAADFLF